MKNQTKLNWQKVLFVALATVALLFSAHKQVTAQQKMKAGDRIGEVSARGSVRKGKVIAPSVRSDRNDCYVIRWDNRNYDEQVCPAKNLTQLVPLDENDQPILGDAETTAAEEEDNALKENPEGDEENADAGGFQPGDRVELKRGNRWVKGTVAANEVQSNKSYVVTFDLDPSSEVRMAMSQVRALSNPETDDGGKAVADAANQKAEQTAAVCAGEPVVNLQTRGRAASPALFGEVIRASFDRAAGNYNYKEVSTIDSLVVGNPYRDVAILIYPVKASLTTCDDAKSSWTIANRENYEFICYVDPARNGEWTCGINKSGTSETSVVPKPGANKVTPVRQ